MTDEALTEELRQRGLRAEFDAPDALTEIGTDADFEDDEALDCGHGYAQRRIVTEP